MVKNNCIIYITLLVFLISSCNESHNDNKIDENSNSSKDVAVIVDSNSFKIDKDEVKDFSVVKEEPLSSSLEVEELVNSEDISKLNKYQLFAQEFISACAKKNYFEAANHLAYNGSDKSRVNKESFNYKNATEQNVVKVTADVIFTFLAESNNYKFMTYKEKSNDLGIIHELEITFFKKGIGVNRRFFEIIETPNGLLISKMK